MARFTVNWRPLAEQRLADLWLKAADPDAITRASHKIETLLARDADSLGESREGNRRVWFTPPLAVVFSVDAAEGVVEVIDINLSRTSGR